MKARISLRGRLALALGTLVALAVGAIAIAEYALARRAMLERLENRELPLLLDSIVARIDRRIAEPVEIARGMAENAYVVDFVRNGEGEGEVSSAARYLERVRAYSGATSSFIVSARTGRYYTGSGIFRTLEPGRTRDAWFTDFLAKGETRDLSFDVDEVTGTATVFVNYALGGDPARREGVAGVGLPLDGLVDMVRAASSGERGSSVYLVDGAGTVQVHADARRIHTSLRAEPALRALVRRPGAIHAYTRGGEALFVGSRAVPDAGWLVVVEMSQDAVLAPLQRTLFVSLLLAFAVGVGAVTTGLFIGKRMAGHLLDRAEQAELIDHMGQALVVFDAQGIVEGETSRRARAVFGGVLRGQRIDDVLYPNALPYDLEAASLREFIPLAFGMPPERWAEIAELAPRELVLRAGAEDEARLTLEWRPIVEEERTARIMLLATDVTAAHKLELARKAEQSQHERELAAMRQLAYGGADNFLSFLRQSDMRMDVLEASLEGEARVLTPAEIELCFRHAHTIRGEARSFGQDHLEAALERLENRLVVFRRRAAEQGVAAVGKDRGLLEAELRLARGELERSRETFVEASPLGRAALDRVSVRRSDVERLSGIAQRCHESLGREGAVLLDVVSRLGARPFGELVHVFVEQVPAWAEQKGKRACLEVLGKETPIPKALAPVLRSTLMHLVRNAVAHGIERPSARTDAGKERTGRITVEALHENGVLRVVVADDGGGIDTQALTQRAEALGIAFERDDAEALVFCSGLSTTLTEDGLSGRGVGMAAVRAELEEAGSTIHVSSVRGRGTRFVIEPIMEPLSNAAE